MVVTKVGLPSSGAAGCAGSSLTWNENTTPPGAVVFVDEKVADPTAPLMVEACPTVTKTAELTAAFGTTKLAAATDGVTVSCPFPVTLYFNGPKLAATPLVIVVGLPLIEIGAVTTIGTEDGNP